MTKQFEYEEYKKLSDAVIDFEKGYQVFVSDCSIYHNKNDDKWSLLDRQDLQTFDQERKYAKRVEIKEKTFEARGIYKNGNFFKIFNSKERADNHMIGRSDFKLILLTGTIKG